MLLIEEICKKCVHYYTNYYMSGMPASCRYFKSAISNLNIINCPYFIERPKNFMFSEEEINSLDSFIKHFND